MPRRRTVRVEVAFHRGHGAAYAWADLVICRAGALTVAELAVTGRPSILVPLPHAIDDHQTANARFLADAGAARLLPQRDWSGSAGAGARAALDDPPGAGGDGRGGAGAGAAAGDAGYRRLLRGAAVMSAAARSVPPEMRRVRRIHLVGVGGSGMSGIAEVLVNLGYEVSGSDLRESSVTRRLAPMGVAVRSATAPRR
jgi:hypothetical protein